MMTSKNKQGEPMRQEFEYLKALKENGGPQESQYEELRALYRSLGQKRKQGLISGDDIMNAWRALSDVYMTKDTMQGYVVLKPHGYAGDFIIIERIYERWLSPKQHLVNWDRFFHAQEAPRAVVNRKKYFIDLLNHLKNKNGRVDVLNIGCGPCQDIAEFISQGESDVYFECIDYDKDAIEYSFNKLKAKGYTNHVEFYRENAFKFRPPKMYDLIWSAGLFDYLDENIFKSLLKKQLDYVKPGGELVVGNFSLDNPSRDYMECGDWFLFHRSQEELEKLARECGVPPENISVRSEALGVNLFLHISR
jgi:SAM-dependent methyltransferase